MSTGISIEMHVLGSKIVKILSRSRCTLSPFACLSVSACEGTFATASFCLSNSVHSLGNTRRYQPSVSLLHKRCRSTHKKQCDVFKFGELRLAVGSSCDVTISCLDPQVYLDQNLVLIDDPASRLSVDCRNRADGISHVSVSEETRFTEPTKSSVQQSDICTIDVPIKYGKI